MSQSECHCNEWTNVAAVEKVGTAKLVILDVDVNLRVIDEESSGVYLRVLTSVEKFPLRVGADETIEYDSLGVGFIQLEFPSTILVIKLSADSIRGKWRNLEFIRILLRHRRYGVAKRRDGRNHQYGPCQRKIVCLHFVNTIEQFSIGERLINTTSARKIKGWRCEGKPDVSLVSLMTP